MSKNQTADPAWWIERGLILLLFGNAATLILLLTILTWPPGVCR